jgi:hypothetical protein
MNRCHRDLALQHRHRVGEASQAVPPQFHVEVEPATNNVQVIVDEAREDAARTQVNDPRRRTGQRHHVPVATDSGEHTVSDRNRASSRVCAIERGDESIPQDQVSSHVRASLSLAVSRG